MASGSGQFLPRGFCDLFFRIFKSEIFGNFETSESIVGKLLNEVKQNQHLIEDCKSSRKTTKVYKSVVEQVLVP